MVATPAPSWPTPPPPDAEQAAAMAAYEALSREERQRVARLVSQTGAPLSIAVAAVVATRPHTGA
jgi:hypothetical protein